MQFEWDEAKRQENLVKHRLDFADAVQIFAAPMRVALDDRVEYGEDRWIGLGLLKSRVVVIVFTESDDGTIRILSLRKALSHERVEYEQALRDRLGGAGPND